MDYLTKNCMNRVYIDQDAFADQEELIRNLCTEWIEDICKMNAHAEEEVIENNMAQINTLFAIGVFRKIDEKKFVHPQPISINNIPDLTEFRKIRNEAKPLYTFLINSFYKKIGSKRYCLIYNTLRYANMLSNIDTIRRKSTIDGVLQQLPTGADAGE